MTTLALSGWGQPHDALAAIAPDAQFVEYARHFPAERALEYMHRHYAHAETVIGWSLGGQMAVRAVAAGVLAPKKLVLIATPWRFVRDPADPLGMGETTYAQFTENYAGDPARTLHKSYALIAKDDSRSTEVRRMLETQKQKLSLDLPWAEWLRALGDFSSDRLNLSRIPPTLLIHGTNDAVVDTAQSARWAERLPHAQAHFMEGAGHAPHWHDPAHVRALIETHLRHA